MSWHRELSGCGLSGIISRKKELIPGEEIIRSIVHQEERGNQLGAGFAGYGIYPQFPDCYALHIMYDHEYSKEETEEYVRTKFHVEHFEDIPIRRVATIKVRPILFR